jgi:SPOR domain
LKALVWIAVLLIIVSFATKADCQTTFDQSQPQEIYLSFNYNGLVNTVITALYVGDSVYIPMGTLLKQLHVDRKITLRDSTIKGFFVNPNNLYEVNFARHVATLGKNQINFDSTQVIIGELDFYVLPSLMNKLFNLNFSVDFNSLALSLTTDEELPIVTEYQREARRNYLITSPQGSFLQAPLAYPRHRSLLNGGIIDYSLTGFGGPGQSAYNYNLTGGAEILGGEAEGTVFGNVSGRNSGLYSSNLSWKYVFDSTDYITSAGLGNLYSNGLTQNGFRGAQISNEPVTVRMMFGKYSVDAKTNPNWDVELYLNGQLVGYSKADAAGNAHFMIPLVYGTSFVQLKYYGPSGEVIESDRRLQIPFTFLPAGQITYTVGGGKLNNTDENFLSGDVVVGITDWLTDKVGMDYVDSPVFSKPLIYNSLSMRMGTEYMMSIDAAPSAYYRSSFNALYPSQTSFDLMYSHYESNLLYNPSNKLQDAQADIFVPVSLSASSFNLRGAAVAQEYVGGQKAYSYSAYVNSSAGQFNTSIGYLESVLDYGGGSTFRSYGLTANVLYSMFFPQGRLDFLNGSLLNMTMRYGVLKNSLDDIRFEVSKNVYQYVRVALAGERDFVNKISTFSLQVVADLPFTRSTSNVQVQNGKSWFTQNVSGSVGFDSKYDHFLFNNLGWVGHSAASMRMFVDNNNNGIYDNGDETINNGAVTLRQAVSSEVSPNGVTREWNLLPYTQYSADIDLSSIRNPLLIPKMKSFSFVTDPNSYKPIDIPFFAGGVVDGSVLRVEGTTATAIPGLTLEIRSAGSDFEKTISVFNDGSFYFMGLPPGKYEAYVDSSQLSMLNMVADPAVLSFEVKPTKNGDYVEGLKILLRDKNPRDTTSTGRLIEGPWKSVVAPHPGIQIVKAEGIVSIGNDKITAQNGVPTPQNQDDKFSSNLSPTSKGKLNVFLNKKSHLYIVQSDTITKRGYIPEKPGRFIGNVQYEDAFVICESEKSLGYCYAIQLAEFRSSEMASEFSEEAFGQIGIKPVVRRSRTSQSFSVVVGPFETEDAAVAAMTGLKKNPQFSNSFAFVLYEDEIPKDITISLDNFSTVESATKFSREIKKRTGLIPVVESDKNEMTFRVSTELLSRSKSQMRFWISSIHTSWNSSPADVATIP